MEQKDFDKLIKTNGKKNLGWKTDRLSYNPDDLENALSSHWSKENKAESWINFGHGTLQDLFFLKEGLPYNVFAKVRCFLKINYRDRLIAATVIQWLGTNCGLCFLREAFKKAGYDIVRTPKTVSNEYSADRSSL